jgi:hypothetical protein
VLLPSKIHLLPSAHSNGCIFPTSSLPCPFSSQLHHTDNINRCLVTQQQNIKAFWGLWIISGPHSRHIPISSTHMQTSRTDKNWNTYISDCRKKFHNTLNMTTMSGPDKPNNHAKNDHGNNLVSVTHKVWDNHVPHELQRLAAIPLH